MEGYTQDEIEKLLKILSSAQCKPLVQNILNNDDHRMQNHLIGVNDTERINSTTTLQAPVVRPSSHDMCMIDIPTYDQIFCAPKKKSRDDNKLYGRKLLAKYFSDQHAIYLSNLQVVRTWLKDSEFVDFNNMDLRHNKELQDKMKNLICNRIHEIKPLNFSGVSYIWRFEDIYAWSLVSIQSKRKNLKKVVNDNDISRKSSADVMPQVSNFHVFILIFIYVYLYVFFS